jgi:squalene-associated FAD-dependent desaturase
MTHDSRLTTRDSRSVIIIGGGVAGIAAAVALAGAGFHVELFEKRPLLGGRASSFIDPETGERLDAGQHGTMRCCTNLADLLERLGVHDRICYHDTIRFLDGEGKRSVIKGCGLPAPLHTALSFLTFRSLGLRDKLAIARGLLAMLRAKPDPKRDETDIAAWFRRMGQTERAVRRFWEPILVSTCNETMERISCAYAFKIFREGFLLHPRAFHFGIPSVPLGTLYTEPTVVYLKRRGGCVRTRAIVDRLHVEDGRVTGITLQSGEEAQADCYVSALQFDLLLKLLPPEVTEGAPYFENLKRLELSPIVGVHVWFDRPLDCPDALALLDRRTDWIFNKTKNFGLPESEGTYLSMVVSADRELTALPKEEIYARVLEEVRACLPEARQANVIRWRVLKERKATFSPQPGVEALRPDQRSPLPNLFVAGEWTQTGWPSTMESAARSGYLAAGRILAQEGIERRVLAPDLPPSGPAKWLDGYRRAYKPLA